MTMTRDKIREVFMQHGFTIKEGQTDLKPYVYEAAESLLALAERALEPQGQALPVAWQVWWGLMEKKPVWPPFATEDEAKQQAAQIKSNTEIRPLYASQLALPAGPVPSELIALLREIRPNYGDVGTRDVDVARQQKQIDRAIEMLAPSPAVAQPVAEGCKPQSEGCKGCGQGCKQPVADEREAFDWQPEQLPEGWKRGDRLRIMNKGFHDGPQSALIHVPVVYVFDRPHRHANDAVAAVAYHKDDMPKVKAWLEWYRGDTPLNDIVD